MRYFLGLFLFLCSMWGVAQEDTVIVVDDPIVIHKEVYFSKPPIDKKIALSIELGLPVIAFGELEGVSDNWVGGTSYRVGAELSLNKWIQSYQFGVMGLQYESMAVQTRINETEHSVTNYDTSTVVSVEYDTVYGGVYQETKTIFIDSTITTTIVERDSNYVTSDTTFEDVVEKQKVKYYSFRYRIARRFDFGNTNIELGVDLIPSLRVEGDMKDFRMTYGADIAVGRLLFDGKIDAGITLNYYSFAKQANFSDKSACNTGVYIKYFLK